MAETTVYLAPDAQGRGLGSALHEKLGFEKISQFLEVGSNFNQWIDVDYWELILPQGGPN